MFKNILLSNIDIDSCHKDYRRLLMTNYSLLIAAAAFPLFGFINLYILSKPYAAFMDVLFLIPTFYGFMQLRRDENINKASFFASILSFIMIMTVMVVYEFHDYIVIWALLYPFIAMNLNGIQNGLKFIIFFNIVTYVLLYYYWMSDPSMVLSYTRFIAVSLIISFGVYFYEKGITESLETQRTLNESLARTAKEANELAITDVLTTLYNKRHFDVVFSDEFNRAKRSKEAFILAIIDVDNFKLFNDTYGHDSGNIALERVGKILKQQTLRSGDYAFRIGGEEFALILQSRTSENVDNHLNYIRKLIEDENLKHKSNIPYGVLTISIGAVSVFSYDSVSLMESYRKADKNLYSVKRSGRNGVIVTRM